LRSPPASAFLLQPPPSFSAVSWLSPVAYWYVPNLFGHVWHVTQLDCFVFFVLTIDHTLFWNVLFLITCQTWPCLTCDPTDCFLFFVLTHFFLKFKNHTLFLNVLFFDHMSNMAMFDMWPNCGGGFFWPNLLFF
jgi:hypothetical protein